MNTHGQATPSALGSAPTDELGAPDDLNAFRGLSLGALLGAAPYARINDGLPFTRERRVEIDR